MALVPLPFVSLAVKYFGAAIHERFDRIQAQLSEVSSLTQESLAGVRVVRAYGQYQPSPQPSAFSVALELNGSIEKRADTGRSKERPSSSHTTGRLAD
jgi:ABC-type multidrug transport system fused ATPase/permease subunit